jgi:hypothetical protein
MSDVDSTLEALLVRWHRWIGNESPDTGYYRINPSCALYRSSRQYDDSNGALDTDNRNAEMEAFDAAVNRLEQPYLTAIQVYARNLSTGVWSWRSSRIPVDEQDRVKLLIVARAKLLRLHPV